jgi:hypothetical protein
MILDSLSLSRQLPYLSRLFGFRKFSAEVAHS